ncbi:MAG: RNA polymerase sigma factor [Methylomonas sp.]|nr:RNA polymerase sigma factor [Methylomonas sp.]
MVSTTNALAADLAWNDTLADELRRFLTRRVKCAEAAADLTQETYIRLQQRDNSNLPIDNARALAFHIAMNLAVDYQRKAAVRSRYMVDGETETLTEATAIGPEQSLIARQRLDKLKSTLDELPPDCRTVFLLHGIDGLKYSEIAARLGISVSMVGRHLARAMAHCAQGINE